MERKRFVGVSLILAAAFFWALQILSTKAALSYANYLQVMAAGFTTAAILLFFFLVASRKSLALPARSLSSVLVLSLSAVTADLIFAYGLGRTVAVNASILSHIQPLFVAIFAYFLLGERLKRGDLAGGILLLMGALAVSAASIPQIQSMRLAYVGDAYIMLAAVFWAGATVAAKKALDEVDPVAVSFYRFLIASVLSIAALFYFSAPAFNPLMLLLGFVLAAGYILYYSGLRLVQSNEATLIELATPLFTAMLAVSLLGEYVTPLQVFGGVLVGSGVYIISTTK